MRSKRFAILLVIVFLCSFVPTYAQEDAEVEILVEGATIGGANGVYVDPDGNLVIASVIDRTLYIVDPESGDILEHYGPSIGVEGPDDIVFGPDGSLYWTSFLTGEVGRLAPDGTVSKQLVAPGVNPIAMSPDGRLFVALCFMGDALYELDPELIEEPRMIYEDQGDGCGLNAMSFGPDGLLYGPRWFQQKVVKVDVDSGEVTTVIDGLGVPAAAKFDSQGHLYIVDQLAGAIIRADLETGEQTVIASGLEGLDNIAFDADDRLFASHAQDGSILEVLPDGTVRTIQPPGMIALYGVAAVDDTVYVADLFSLREFDAETGELIHTQRSVIGMPGGIVGPFTVAAGEEYLILTTWFGNEVQVWDPVAREPIATYHDFAVPMNAIEFQGDLVVIELGTGSITRLSDDEHILIANAESGLAVPIGLAASDDGLWVSDWATGMIWQLVADGETLAEPVAVASGLKFPEGLALMPDGDALLVVEAGTGSVLSVDLASGEVTTLASELGLGAPGVEGMPPTWGFNGIAVAHDGTIFVTGDVSKVLYRITP